MLVIEGDRSTLVPVTVEQTDLEDNKPADVIRLIEQRAEGALPFVDGRACFRRSFVLNLISGNFQKNLNV